MFFMALASAFLVRKGTGDWIPVHIPVLLWLNTIVLLLSSVTLEVARKRLAKNDPAGFRNFWLFTTVLGILFLVGQFAVWRQLNSQGHLPGYQSREQLLLCFYREPTLCTLSAVFLPLFMLLAATSTLPKSPAPRLPKSLLILALPRCFMDIFACPAVPWEINFVVDSHK